MTIVSTQRPSSCPCSWYTPTSRKPFRRYSAIPAALNGNAASTSLWCPVSRAVASIAASSAPPTPRPRCPRATYTEKSATKRYAGRGLYGFNDAHPATAPPISATSTG